VTGRGADLLIIDDPHSEQDINSPKAFDNAYEWYTSGPRQRMQPGGAIVIVMTRWSTKDLTAQLVNAGAKEEKADQWEVVEFPAVMPSGEPCWPEYWKLEELEKVKASAGMSKWNAQYMQNPTAEEGALLKREEEFAKEQYDYWQPETVLVEAKASGLPLTYELRQMGIPVVNFSPSKGNDKHSRVNSVAPLFESGMVWAPKEREFAQEVIEECASFPYGDHDDLVDSTTQALMRFRQGGLIIHPEDYKEEQLPRKKRTYYW
jgi:predicted phage terminase large subunit-like protein